MSMSGAPALASYRLALQSPTPGADQAIGLEQRLAHASLRRIEVTTPNGSVSYAAPPVRWADGTRTPGAIPAIGAHSAAIRAEFAG